MLFDKTASTQREEGQVFSLATITTKPTRNLGRQKMKTAISRTQYVAAAGHCGGQFAVGFISGPAFAGQQAEVRRLQLPVRLRAEEFATTDSASKLLDPPRGQGHQASAGQGRRRGTRPAFGRQETIKETMDQTVRQLQIGPSSLKSTKVARTADPKLPVRMTRPDQSDRSGLNL